MKNKVTKKKHILVVSQYFYPEQFRINDMCKEWVKRGYKVTVLTGIPNYPQGKFYKGYGWRKKRREIWNGIEIIRIPLIARGHNAVGLIMNYLSFPISGYIWKIFTKIKADYVFNFETSPMTQSLIAVWYAKKRKIPCYIYVQDLWPENVEIVTGIHHPIVIKPIEKMVDYLYKNFDEIFGTSPSFVKSICDRGVPEKKVHYWPQYAEEFYKVVEKKEIPEIPSDDTFKIAFTGNIGYAQGLGMLPAVAEKLKRENCKVAFYIIGDGRYKEEFKKEIKKKNVEDTIHLLGRHPAERIPEMLAVCDAAYISFMADPLFEKTIPAKLQSYMACGMPIIAAARGETQRIIEEAECGVCSPIDDIGAMVENIKLMMNMEKNEFKKRNCNSKEYCNQFFSKKMLMNEIDKYFNLN